MSDFEHIKEIETVGSGVQSQRDHVVLDSWLRCLNEHNLDPSKQQGAYIVPATQLREHRQQSEELINIARSGIEELYRQVGGQNYVVLLSDQKGVTVEFMGDAFFNNQLQKAGLFMGSEWSEERAGTCAVGACLKTGETLTIHQTDHFDGMHTGLSCTAAPIYSAAGELSAVLDISLLSSPIVKVSQNLALHFVEAAARRIELANLMAKSPHEWVLRFARSPDFLDVDPEAAVAIDGSGNVSGLTHNGAKLLAKASQRVWREPEALIGQPISLFLEMDVNDLPQLTRGRPAVERLVRTRFGHGYFVHAIEPQPKNASLNHKKVDVPKPLRKLSDNDPAMTRMQYRAGKLANTNVGILIQGETGTGKEYLARAIHESSGRQGRFVAINCAAIPEHLIESELFGHLGGAFTGAAPKGRKGLIEEADKGTLFLDEIGDMPLVLQSRLLRVLSEKQVQPVGSTHMRTVDVRVLAATHRSLVEQVAAGEFRADLLYRINAATLTLPALRNRCDFKWLVEKLLERHGNGQIMSISDSALISLKSHDWPGNLRELDNAIAVAVALTETGLIDVKDLPESLLPYNFDEEAESNAAPDPKSQLLKEALEMCDWNISAAARRLAVDRSTIHRQIKRFGLARS
ncbi:sigma-54-dependent Fis family transcriptional regulator [Granulosicoccus antarcticus]|uniref:Acetoin catabolism regulatory protein n=1 Tax=Granulosicoccus antarcticus IMCC3135 TaxID=1192854 RepID=A0A2Z2NTG5_9GAMM|nr:sigma-54-dependent Fis family transcriptional regulator [Granulosicoccus antarcticus]ASJ74786.1 Acetoin catabolism regulatory protein [Granulosicoccus antarcticus IMCC3135]